MRCCGLPESAKSSAPARPPTLLSLEAKKRLSQQPAAAVAPKLPAGASLKRATLWAGLQSLQAAGGSLVGWQVVLLRDPRLVVGRVDEVLEAGASGSGAGGAAGQAISNTLLCVSREANLARYKFKGREEHLVPLVSAILPSLNAGTRTLYMVPPKGLLDLGRLNLKLAFLRDALWPYSAPVVSPGGVVGPDWIRRMPTQAALKAAGRQDLAQLVESVGGSALVALRCGFRSRSRPAGYWDAVDNLDLELDAFVDQCWVQLPHPDTGKPYYFNQVTSRVRLRKPPATHIPGQEGSGQSSRRRAAGLVPERVLPSNKMLTTAGRYDLINAVRRHGGYRAVSDLLSRPPAHQRCPALRTAAGLRSELSALARQAGLPKGVMPSEAQLQGAGRLDVLGVVRRAGGFARVGHELHLQAQRRPRGRWRDEATVVQELLAFTRQQTPAPPAPPPLGSTASRRATPPPPPSPGGTRPPASGVARKAPLPPPPPPPASLHLPTRALLRQCGRHDLAYALTLHDGARIARLCGAAPQPLGAVKNRLTLGGVLAALQAGHSGPAGILEHLTRQGCGVARAYLATQLSAWVLQGCLARPARGQYSAPPPLPDQAQPP